MKVRRIDGFRCILGEGAVWDVAEEALFLLDIGRRQVLRYDPAGDSLRSWETPAQPGTMALRERGGAVVGMRDRVATLDFATGAVEPIAIAADQPANATFNDGATDRQGRFVIGSCAEGFDDPQPIGGVYSLGLDGVFARVAGDITFSNSHCFSPDGRTLYAADSFRHLLYAYDYDPATGAVGERRPFVDTRPLGGMPDGATVDADGLVWMAIFRAGLVAAFRPDGTVERSVPIPASLAASVTFGGPGLDQLYVATIDPSYFGEPADEGGGYLYVIEGLGARGVSEVRYAG